MAARREAQSPWLSTLLEPFPTRRTSLQAAVAHATAFATWQSLCVEQGLSNRSAVDLTVGMASQTQVVSVSGR